MSQKSRNEKIRSVFVCCFCFLCLLAAAGSARGAGVTFIDLHDFDGTNGFLAVATMIQATDGCFYGATLEGGGTTNNGNGTIYKITPDGEFTLLFAFGATNGTGSQSSLMQAADGWLYGVTFLGGTGGAGTIYKISTNGVFTNLFSPEQGYGAPDSTLIQDTNGNFIGTTDHGFIFSFNPASGEFNPLAVLNGTNGAAPSFRGLVLGQDGSYYGAAAVGGPGYSSPPNVGLGTIFRLSPDGVLSSVASFDGTNGSDPIGNLVQDTNGDFCGATRFGGIGFSPSPGAAPTGLGTVFKLTTKGDLSALVLFNGTNGDKPFAGLTQGSDGNFYGTTSSGGANGLGTIFKLTPNGTFSTLYSFDQNRGGSPQSGLVQGSDGNFYGTTTAGGLYQMGGIFKLIIHPDFFNGEDAFPNDVYYLTFTNKTLFGYYTYDFFPYLYHFDLGFEYYFDAHNDQNGAYLYDFTSGHFWYTSPELFPYIYDFGLNAWLYYFQDPNQPGHYTSNPRWFYDFASSSFINE